MNKHVTIYFKYDSVKNIPYFGIVFPKGCKSDKRTRIIFYIGNLLPAAYMHLVFFHTLYKGQEIAKIQYSDDLKSIAANISATIIEIAIHLESDPIPASS